jgi:hypothetical protein
MQVPARSESRDGQVDERRLDQPALLVASLGPGVGEVGADACERPRREHVAEQVDGVARGHPYVREALGADPLEQPAEPRCVHVDGQQVGPRVGGGHRRGRLAGTEADLDDDRPIVAEQLGEVERPAVDVDPVDGPEPLDRAGLARGDATPAGVEAADRPLGSWHPPRVCVFTGRA